ncbi:MAG TPA: metallophosphoesterase [Clostridia bacterium]|nr:metallophosphoesterase [Clostridia bacterium]
MPNCFFATDLHGSVGRSEKLLACILRERPFAVFLGGDLLPGCSGIVNKFDFLEDVLIPALSDLRRDLRHDYPAVFVILGNDDPRVEEARLQQAESAGLWSYMHGRKQQVGGFEVYGYACVPPTPFLLKDWERYDISRYVDPGCVSPEEGIRSAPPSCDEVKWQTISDDLEQLTGDNQLQNAVFLFHAPPYDTPLDHAALDGQMFEHVPLDVHVGSIAIRRFIEARQPMLTLHGHVHESTRLTGTWRTEIGRTVCINAAHDGPELALVRFDLESPAGASRELI